MSGAVIISDQRLYIKIETLHVKNSTEIHSALSEVCGEFTVDRSTVSCWANRFHGGCVSIDNDPKPGRSRISTDERSVKLVADALEDRRATCEEILEPWERKLRRKMYKNLPQLLISGPLILHDNARLHITDVVTKKVTIMGGKCYLMHPTVHTRVHQTGADSEGGPGPSLSDQTAIIKFSYPVLKYILHSFSFV